MESYGDMELYEIFGNSIGSFILSLFYIIFFLERRIRTKHSSPAGCEVTVLSGRSRVRIPLGTQGCETQWSGVSPDYSRLPPAPSPRPPGVKKKKEYGKSTKMHIEDN
ncbi:unnamed protein product [Cuscuta epithymum]|uniref:Uncharacterized protein n=1 Tax=Cuscuta epithymum TaxID=186058 RepID=A0AAV0FHL1_9ASTE|nr:unnamed protein product [Cuscuta epithymum]